MGILLRKLFMSPASIGGYIALAVALVPLAIYWHISSHVWWQNALSTTILIAFTLISLVFISLAFSTHGSNVIGALIILYVLLMVLLLYGSSQAQGGGNGGLEECPAPSEEAKNDSGTG